MSESPTASPSSGSPRPFVPGGTPGPVAGTLIGLGTILLFLAGGLLLAPLGVAGVGLSEWLFLAVPVVVALRWGGFDPGATLGLERPGGRALLGGGLLMVGGLSLNWAVAWAQSPWIPVPTGITEAMAEQLRAESGLEVVALLAAAALTPAICEELVFRGLLLRSWRRWPAALAIGINALAFGALHWLPGSAFRVLPAATSGALIAWAVWHTRSLWVGIWMHLLNNGLLLLAASTLIDPDTTGVEGAVEFGAESAPPLAVLIPMLAVAALGVRLLRTAPRAPDLAAIDSSSVSPHPPLAHPDTEPRP